MKLCARRLKKQHIINREREKESRERQRESSNINVITTIKEITKNVSRLFFFFFFFSCLTFLTFSPRLASFFSRWKRPTRDERFSQNHTASSVSVSFFSPRAPHDPTSDNIRLFARERHALLFTPHDTLSTVARSDFSPRLHVRLLRRDVLPGEISVKIKRRRR